LEETGMKGRAAAAATVARVPGIDPDAGGRGDSIWAPFRVRSFRFQWPADLLTSWAFEMETLVLGWYVLVETDSVLLLTLFGSLQFLGTLIAPSFGVAGDRLGRGVLLCGMRAIYAALATTLLTLSFAGLLTPFWVIGIALLSGLVRPSDLVMRNALIGDTIPQHQFMGAMSLSRTTMDSARIAGALAGAGLFAALGIGPTYVFVACFYLAGLALTFGVSRARPQGVPDTTRSAAGSPWRDLLDGISYVWNTPKLLALMWLAFLVNITGYPITNGLLPYVAKAIYGVDQTGLSYLVAAFALGALLGSVTMAATGWPRRPERTTLVASLVWYLPLLVFVRVDSLPLGLAVLMLTGLAQSIAMIAMAVTLLNTASGLFRGRVMGVRMLAVYGLPLGLVASGPLIQRFGFASAMSGYAAVGALFTVAIAVRWRAELWWRRAQSA